ncbi:MAG: hypothetical protein KJ706_00120 [Candidatus Omnitrophica bacterium]|nr:hypothetical protein [Candidatus Omnitrophota bacterium]
MKNKYKGLSKDEIYLISRVEFEKQKLITTAFVQKVFEDKNKAARILVYLKRKGRILRIERGKYLLVPLKAPNQRWMPNEFLVASLWMGDTPYYIGYSSAYNYWGLTDQVPQTVFILNTQKGLKKIIGKVAYSAVKISSKKIYGLEKISIEGEVVFISDKERTLVDFIYKPMGSWANVEGLIREQLKEISVEKLIRYLGRFPVVSVRKRAGLMLQRLGISQKILLPLQYSIGKENTYIAFNPFIKSRKGKVNREWKVIING